MCSLEEKGHDASNSFTMERADSWLKNDLPSPSFMRMDDGIHNGVHRLKALGNSIVPQIAFEIFKAIEQYIYE